MTFIPQTFTSGAILPALTLNETVGNIDHVREEAAFKHIATPAPEDIYLLAMHGPGDVGIRLLLDGATLLGDAQYGSGAQKAVNIDLAAVGVGLHTLVFQAVYRYSGTVYTTDTFATLFRFMRTEDLNYLSYWATRQSATYSDGSYTGRYTALSVIGHRTFQGTW